MRISEKANVQAFVVLNKKGEHRATVQFLYPRDGAGAITCEVWSIASGDKHLSLTHKKKAGGYGYDKKTAALAGAVIDGMMMANHCGHGEAEHEAKKARLMRAYIKACANGMTQEQVREWSAKAERIGCNFANWSRAPGTPVEPGTDGKPVDGYRYTSLHTFSGLDRLRRAGYRIIGVF